MSNDSAGLRRLVGGMLLMSAVGFAAGCSDITPEPNDTGGGVIDSPTHEADQEREMQQNQMGGGGGGGGGGGARR
jgi:hypothetical protein